MTKHDKHAAMTETMLARVAAQFRALGEPSRLKLINLLFDGERTVGELAELSSLSLANVSKHMGLLHQAGWVARRKDGLTVVYQLVDDGPVALCELMCDRVRERAAAEARLASERRIRRA